MPADPMEARILDALRASPLLAPVTEALRDFHGVFVVGGALRDAGLGRGPIVDLDLAVAGPAREAAAAVARALRGTAFVLHAETEVYRVAPKPGLFPPGAQVDVARIQGRDIAQDLARRDFTVNAMAVLVGPQGLGETLDPFGGKADLKARVLRVLHARSFIDDPTRLLRAARYAARLGLKPDPGTQKLVDSARGLGAVSRERIRQELWRILEEKDPVPALRLCLKWKLAGVFHPKFKIPDGLAKQKETLVRAGLLAFALGRDGEEFARSLPLPREDSAALLSALKTDRLGATPAQPLPEAAVRLLRAARPRLAKAALAPRLVTGGALLKAGFKPGPGLAAAVDEAARAQWSGRLRDAAGAAAFLRRAVRRQK